MRAVGDHNVINVTIRTKGSDTKRLDTRKRSYKNFNPSVFRQRLERETCSEIYDITSVDLANDFLESRVVGILDELCPYKTIQFRSVCKTWLSEETKDLMKTRDNTRETARQTDNADDWKLYRSQRNKVNRLVNTDRRKHYDDIYTKHYENKDVGGTYKAAKNQAGWFKNTSPTSFLIDGRKITDPQDMANLQSKTFSDKTSKLLDELPPPTIDPCASLQSSLNKWGNKKESREIFKFKPITNMDTLKILKELGNTTSQANDRIDALSLKHGAQTLHGPITHIINCSIKHLKICYKVENWKAPPSAQGQGTRSQRSEILQTHLPPTYHG